MKRLEAKMRHVESQNRPLTGLVGQVYALH